MKHIALYLGLGALLIAGAGCNAPSKSLSQHITLKNVPPMEMQIDAAKSYTATLHTTKGDIVIALDAKNTPVTANNFVALARKGFYNGTIFHRTLADFMIQGGDPAGTGSGDYKALGRAFGAFWPAPSPVFTDNFRDLARFSGHWNAGRRTQWRAGPGWIRRSMAPGHRRGILAVLRQPGAIGRNLGR